MRALTLNSIAKHSAGAQIGAGAEKLSGQERYRVRQGDYRILYEIEDQILRIMVVKIGHRRDVYRT